MEFDIVRQFKVARKSKVLQFRDYSLKSWMTVSINLLKANPLVWLYARLTHMSYNIEFGSYMLSFPSSEISIIISSHCGLRFYVLSFQSSWLSEFEAD